MSKFCEHCSYLLQALHDTKADKEEVEAELAEAKKHEYSMAKALEESDGELADYKEKLKTCTHFYDGKTSEHVPVGFVNAAQETIDELKAELADLKGQLDTKESILKWTEGEIARIAAERDRLREALEDITKALKKRG